MWETLPWNKLPLGASNSLFGVCPAWVSDSPNWWYRGVRDMAPARAQRWCTGDPNYPSRMCFKFFPQLGSRNQLPSYDTLQDVKGPLHSKLSIKSFSVLAQISLKLTIDSIFAVAVTGWFPSHCGPHRYKSPSKSGTAVGTKQHAKHGDPGIKDMTRSIRQHFVSWRIALQFKMPTLGPKDMGETG